MSGNQNSLDLSFPDFPGVYLVHPHLSIMFFTQIGHPQFLEFHWRQQQDLETQLRDKGLVKKLKKNVFFPLPFSLRSLLETALGSHFSLLTVNGLQDQHPKTLNMYRRTEKKQKINKKCKSYVVFGYVFLFLPSDLQFLLTFMSTGSPIFCLYCSSFSFLICHKMSFYKFTNASVKQLNEFL